MPAALWAINRSYQAFAKRVQVEARAGYSSLDRTPFGDAVHGLWTGLRSGHPQAPQPAAPWAKPAVDPVIADALDSRLELSPSLSGISVPASPPRLLPGRSAAELLTRGSRLAVAGWASWLLLFPSALILPTGSLRTTVVVCATGVYLTLGPAGFIIGLVGHNRAFAERAAGYTTLHGRDDTMVTFGRGVPADAWETLGTDHLWHIDPKTGSVIRPPLDPTWALRDHRVHRSIGRFFAWAPRVKK